MTLQKWELEPITFSQQNQIFHHCMKPVARKFVGENFYRELEKLNKGQASQVMGLLKQMKGGQALLRLKSFKMPITIKEEDIHN